MLLIVVGAGASFDSIPDRVIGSGDHEAYRQPLADQLFGSRAIFKEMQRAIPQLMPIVPELQFRPNEKSVEDVLGEFAAQTGNPDRPTQLAAVRFYIQAVIHTCEQGWYRDRPVATNMMSLVDRAENARRGRTRPLFVTFNYDRLIEQALDVRCRQTYGSLPEYINPSTIRLYKLHGSVDWARRIGPLNPHEYGGTKWAIAGQICDNISKLHTGGQIESWVRYDDSVPSSSADASLAIPAIAIPVKEKSEFECPPEHLQSLEAELKNITHVLTIGWRGGEQHFLKLFRKHARDTIRWLCIGGRPGDSEGTIANIQAAGLMGLFQGGDDGFTHFVNSGLADRFFNEAWA